LPSARESVRKHLTYGQGAAAEIVAMGDRGGGQFWLARLDDPCAVVWRRGHDGGQWVRRTNVDDPQHRSRWVLPLPCAMALSAFLFFVFRHLF
jgi:inorganic phosphate transporter, PiT family